MMRLVEDSDVHKYVRGAVLDAILTLMVEGVISRDGVIELFRDLFRSDSLRDGSLVLTLLVSAAHDLYPQELLPEIKWAFDEGLVATYFIGWPDIERQMKAGMGATLDQLRSSGSHHFVRDVVGELEGWVCFQPPMPESPTPQLEPMPPEPWAPPPP